jgi:uncharacterized protein (UPF0248 family)
MRRCTRKDGGISPHYNSRVNLRDLFNDRKWHTGDLAELRITVRHRGAPRDERVVRGASILEVQPRGLLLEASDLEEDDVFLPYHRVLRIEGPNGLLWTHDERDD